MTPVALMHAGLSRTVQTPASEGNITAAMKQELYRRCAILLDNWDCPNRGFLKRFLKSVRSIPLLALALLLSDKCSRTFIHVIKRCPLFGHLIPCANGQGRVFQK
jgi:hypothetical protein